MVQKVHIQAAAFAPLFDVFLCYVRGDSLTSELDRLRECVENILNTPPVASVHRIGRADVNAIRLVDNGSLFNLRRLHSIARA